MDTTHGGWGAPSATRPGRFGPGLKIVAAAVGAAVVLVGIGVGIWAWRGTSGPPSYEALWSVPLQESGSERAQGSWLLDDVVVRAEPAGVLAYDQATGKRAWGVPIPGDLSVLCGMSPDTRSGVGIVAYGTDGDCDRVMAIDTRSGKKVWSSALMPHLRGTEGQLIPTSAAPMVTNGAVVIEHSYAMVGLKPSDGSVLWRMTPGYESCSISNARAGSRAVVVLASCDKGFESYAVDPRTGRRLWSTRLPAPADVTSGAVLHASPPVVYINGKDYEKGTLYSLSNGGKIRAKIPQHTKGRVLEIKPDEEEGARGSSLIRGDTLLATTQTADDGGEGQYSESNKLVAIDLATGKQRWGVRAALGREITLVKGPSPDGTVFAYDTGDPYDPETPPKLLSVAVSDGAKKPLATYPGDVSTLWIGTTTYARDDRVFFVSGTGIGTSAGPKQTKRAIVTVGKPAEPQ